MNIGIIGAGSIGLLFASYLSSVFNVTLYTRTLEQAEEIQKNGLLLKKRNQIIKIKVKALPFSKWEGADEFTFIAVKQHQLEMILRKLTELSIKPKNLFFLQNGMGHIAMLEKISADNIFIGTVEHGALKMNPFTVSHNGEGMTKVAVFRGDHRKLQSFVSAAPSEFPIEIHSDYYQMLINKLIVNATINPLTAILEVKNGTLLENEFYFLALKHLFAEIIYILDIDDRVQHFEQIVLVCKNTAENHSSMLKDLDAKRRTEVEPILGFLLKEANKRGKKAPQITNLYYLIKGKENAWRDSF
jgi:2-dehydropantoate 2-reductase